MPMDFFFKEERLNFGSRVLGYSVPWWGGQRGRSLRKLVTLYPDKNQVLVPLYPDKNQVLVTLYLDKKQTLVTLYPDKKQSLVTLYPDKKQRDECMLLLNSFLCTEVSAGE